MPPYRQPGHAIGKCDPAAVSATCPQCGLVGRSTGTSSFRFVDDNGHRFDAGATAILVGTPPKVGVREEPGASQFFDVVSGVHTKP